MSKFVAGHVIFKIMNYLFLNANFTLELQESWKKKWCGNIYSTSECNYQLLAR